MRYEAKTKGLEKVIAENERLRKELKSETDTSEKLRISKRNLEFVNEKLSANLEETRNKLSVAESRGPQLEGADGKAWKSVVVSKLYETKMKEMEAELLKRNDSIVDLKRLLKEATEREQKTEQTIQHLRDECTSAASGPRVGMSAGPVMTSRSHDRDVMEGPSRIASFAPEPAACTAEDSATSEGENNLHTQHQ
ncbi:unnamed protein product [Ranitomeya imitator]|uniref:Uncharacterized protein n=1 Tax=Ranitomeya imitator TaxID=111125 RepID=A0ABN9KSQ5_9NEOB|nr:unnamed protein product [Ranitomeya imitator]